MSSRCARPLAGGVPDRGDAAPRDLRHVKLLYGIGGLSYGNVSARRLGPTESGYGPEFWIDADGVDESNLREIGHDVLLIKGYEPVARHHAPVDPARM